MRSTTVLLALPLLAVAGCGTLTDARGVAAGFVAHQLCTTAFVMGADPEAYYRESLAGFAGPLRPLITHAVDRPRREVRASAAGETRRAVYREGLGCLVEHGSPPAPVAPAPFPDTPPALPPIAGPDLVEPATTALAAALDNAFAEPRSGPRRGVKAVVVVHGDRIVAERYAPGFSQATPMHGWSLSKSAINALAGVLAHRGDLDMHAPAPVAEWADPADPRHAITPDHLLRMTSGLELGQSLSSSPASALGFAARSVFDVADGGAFAAAAAPAGPPGARWTYSDASTLLLSRIIRDKAGGDAAAVTNFARCALFAKLGMTSAILETDAAGTPLGGTHLVATARDWAKLGVLYLNDGMAGSERLLPEGWVAYSTALTPGSELIGYGAGFWTNEGDSIGKHKRLSFGFPEDAFMGRGSFGQFLIVVPSQRVVVVIMCWSSDPNGDVVGAGRLVRETIAALGG